MSHWNAAEVNILRWSVETLISNRQDLTPTSILSHIKKNHPHFARTELAVRCKLVDVVPNVVGNLQAILNQQIHFLLNQPPVIVTVPGPVVRDDDALRLAEAQLLAANALLEEAKKTHDEDLEQLRTETSKLQRELKSSTDDNERHKLRSELLDKAVVATGEILRRLPSEPLLCSAICDLSERNFADHDADRLAASTGTPCRPDFQPVNVVEGDDEVTDAVNAVKKLDLEDA